MRLPLATLLLLLLLAGCARVAEVARTLAGRPGMSTEQCFSRLAERPGVRFRRLPDRQDAPGCTLAGAVQLLDVGVVIRGAGPLTCPMALRLDDWLDQGVRPAAARYFPGDEVVGIDSFGTYACRSRNNASGAPLSEHATGNALDVGGFRFRSGRRLSVRDGWRSADPAVAGFLREVHRAGCRSFRVAIGPDANTLHHDHLHFDMGSGAYCR